MKIEIPIKAIHLCNEECFNCEEEIIENDGYIHPCPQHNKTKTIYLFLISYKQHKYSNIQKYNDIVIRDTNIKFSVGNGNCGFKNNVEFEAKSKNGFTLGHLIYLICTKYQEIDRLEDKIVNLDDNNINKIEFYKKYNIYSSLCNYNLGRFMYDDEEKIIYPKMGS